MTAKDQPDLRVGIVGFGYWGPNLVRNLYTTPGIRPEVIVDQSPARLELAQQRAPGVRTTTELDELLEDEQIDAVVVATPISTHFSVAQRALNAGKHVLVEKPMTATVDEAEALVALARERDRRLMVDHTFLFNPALRTIRELIDRGELGEVLYFDSTRINLGLYQHDVSVIWDLAPHDFAIMDYLLGKAPQSVTSIGSKVGEQASIAYVVAQFGGSPIAHFHLNWLSPVKVRRLILGGTKKMVVWDMVEPEAPVRIYDKGMDFIEKEGVHQTLVQYRIGEMRAPCVPTTEPLGLMCREFVGAIRENRQPLSDGKQGLQVVRLLAASQRSLESGGSPVLLM